MAGGRVGEFECECDDAGMAREEAVNACFWDIFQTPSSDVKVSFLLVCNPTHQSTPSETCAPNPRSTEAPGWDSQPPLTWLEETYLEKLMQPAHPQSGHNAVGFHFVQLQMKTGVCRSPGASMKLRWQRNGPSS